jgi:RHS repeat-associated protein
MKPLTLRRTLQLGWRARWNTTAAFLLPIYFVTSAVPYNVLLADPAPASTVAKQPSIVLTPKNVHVNKRKPHGAAYAGPSIPSNPTDQDITLSHAFTEPLVPLGGAASSGEDAQLGTAIKKYLEREKDEDVSALTDFVAGHPDSPWRVSLDLNLAENEYKNGAFSEALNTWKDAWDRSKSLTDPKGVLLANFAVAKLAKMNARIGRVSDLETIATQVKGRSFSGSAAQIYSEASSGFWLMKHRPQDAFRCGVSALQEILMTSKRKIADPSLLEKAQSTPQGISLNNVAKLSGKVGLSMQMAKRTEGASFIVPSVVHWKLGHYAAVVGEHNGKYEIHDTTFGGENFMVSADTLNREASGYFLVPSGPLPNGWTSVTKDEASKIFGRGDPQGAKTGAFGPDTPSVGPVAGGDCGFVGVATDLLGAAEQSLGKKMTVPSVKALLVSLTLSDTPVGYTPPVGPSMPFSVIYNQKDNTQPATFTYGNFGPGWTYGFLSYITPGASTSTVYERGGGVESFYYNSSASTWYPSANTQEILTQVNSTTWTRTFPTGDIETYGMPDGSGRFFLTGVTDPQGNSLSLSYDANLRLTAITDALGQVTTVTYESNTVGNLPSFYLISQVTDPFGRSANFAYNSSNQLKSITDVIGITSSFSYLGSGFINLLTTPYGQTSFAYGEGGNTGPGVLRNTEKWLNITFPDGNTTRTEYNDEGIGIPGGGVGDNGIDPVGIPSGTYVGVPAYNENLFFRNTYYWDQQAYKNYAGDYTKARLIHWLHSSDLNIADDIEESHKFVDQNRIWFAYSGEISSLQASQNMFNLPSHVGRILDNNMSQVFAYTYNSIGKVTAAIDPLGRETDYTYATNNIDLLTVRQKNSSGSDLLATYTYNGQHEVLTATDASGQETVYTYQPNGELSTVTDPKGNKTTYNYNGSGYLTSVVGAISGATQSFTYDGFGRVATTTDSQGYVATINYDADDRPTQVSFPDGTTSQTVYQNLDAVYTKDRQGHWLRTFYNSVEEPISVIDSSGSSIATNWTPAGQVQSFTDSLGHTTSWQYDGQNRPVVKTYADGSSSSIQYENTTSRVKSVTDVAGQVTTPTYNLDNTVSQVTYTNATVATPTVSYSYDTVYPRVLTMGDATGTTTYNYNPVSGAVGSGMLGSVQTPLATVSYIYDQLGREIGEKINDSATGQGLADSSASVVFDALGRTTSVTNALSGSGSFGYAYQNATGRVSTFTTPTGPSTSYIYADTSPRRGPPTPGSAGPRLISMSNVNSTEGTISEFQYTYDADGKISTWLQVASGLDNQQWTMGYDAVGKLTSVADVNGTTHATTNYAYNYDVSGNRTNTQIGSSLSPAQSNSLNQYVAVTGPISEAFAGSLSKPGKVTVAGAPATMDGTYTNFLASVSIPSGGATNNVPVVATSANGYAKTNNYQVIVPPSSASPGYDANGNLTSDSIGTYSWDAKGELVKITYPNTSYSTFTYNGAGQRVEIQEYDSTPSHNLTSTKQFVGGSMLTEERDASNHVIKRFFAQGEQQISSSTATNYYYTRDHLGSIRELTNTTGAVQARYAYDPYGQRTQVSGSASTEVGFTGFYYHAASGLYLSATRAYNASNGRWISRDSSGEEAGLNLYAYCDDNPINEVDPNGATALAWGEVFVGGEEAAATVPFWEGLGTAILGVVAAPEVLAVGAVAAIAVAGVLIYEHESQNEPLPPAAIAAPVQASQAQVIAAAPGRAPKEPCQEDSPPTGRLRASENAGGHLLARHVGKTEADLAARLAANPGMKAASTFASEAEAESGVATALNANGAKVASWASSGANGRLVLDAPFSGGMVLQRGAASSIQGSGVRVILQGDGAGGFHILTGFPTP